MLDLHAAFRNFSADIEPRDTGIDSDFITNFLLPYFNDLPREQLEAMVAEVISQDLARPAVAPRLR